MKPEKVRQVIERYRKLFEKLGVDKIDYPHDEIIHSLDDILGHCHGMLDRMLQFIDEGRMEKVFRWLGFIQGCLWSSKVHVLEDLKNHDRLDSE